MPRNAQKLAATAEELRTLGYDVLERQTDVSSEAAVESFFKAVMERFGRVDILVNNAGNFDGGRVDTISLAAWNNVIGAALTGAFLCSRAVFRIMKEQGGGRILNIGSISGQRPREGSAGLHLRKVRSVGPHQCRRTRRPALRHLVQLSASGKCACRMARRSAFDGPPRNR